MSPSRLILAFVGIALEATLLVGLVMRGRLRECLCFPVYVAAVLVPSFVFAVWPEFYTWDNYLLREIVHNLLKFAIALELAYRTFGPFPGALAQGKRLIVATVVVVAVVAMSALSAHDDPTQVQIEWHARMLNGTIWLFTAIAAVTLWYRLPVGPLQKSILVGFVPYLLTFSVGMRAFVEMGWDDSQGYQLLHMLAYAALLLYWNRVAWSRAGVPASAVAEPARQPGLA